jgi:hypothetical protein
MIAKKVVAGSMPPHDERGYSSFTCTMNLLTPRLFSRSEASLYPTCEEGASVLDINVSDAFENSVQGLGHISLPKNMAAFTESTSSTRLTMQSTIQSPERRTPARAVQPERNQQYDNRLQSLHSSVPTRLQDSPPDQYFYISPESSFQQHLTSSSSSSRGPLRQVRLQVEVSPGEYMSLRGAEETIQAIESGYSKFVKCYGCNAQLQCVGDCQLVLCPDCKIMSPALLEPESFFNKQSTAVPHCCWMQQQGDDQIVQQQQQLPPSCYDNETSWKEPPSHSHHPTMFATTNKQIVSVGGLGLGVKI